MTINPSTEYWGARSERYDNLQWAKNRIFLDRILVCGKFLGSDKVLDVGTGTGTVAKHIAPFVRWVAAVDFSPDMLERAARNGATANISFLVGDACQMRFANDVFDKVVARYCLHHIVENVSKAVDECYRVLKLGGMMIFAEGVPPSTRTRDYFEQIFELKEKRLTFLPEDMKSLLSGSGFGSLTTDIFWLRQMSVRNWLDNNGDLETSRKELIFDLHRNAPAYVKEDYKMTETAEDCFIDMRVAIVTGTKTAK